LDKDINNKINDEIKDFSETFVFNSKSSGVSLSNLDKTAKNGSQSHRYVLTNKLMN
jgi:hypothetical protein